MQEVLLKAVPAPQLPQCLPDVVVAVSVVGHTKKLIAYYRQLIDPAAEVGLDERMQDPFPYFRVKPVIVAGDEAAAFPWYDTVAETAKLLRALATCPPHAAEPLEIFDDLEQGWQVRLATWRGRVGLVEWNWENTDMPTAAGVSFDAIELANQAAASMQRLDRIHHELTQAFGRDCWNYG